MTGWQEHHDPKLRDPLNPCSEPICEPKCLNGECVAPDVCACDIGWYGTQCGNCIPLGGCVNGGCTEPFECNCNLASDEAAKGKYQGPHCNLPLCTEECVHGTCVEPDSCQCFKGWSGNTCNKCIKMPGCMNGDCIDTSNACFCHEGWSGPLCTEPICASGCNTENAVCTKPEECICKTGWSGNQCNQCVPNSKCPNQGPDSCILPNECICKDDMDHVMCNQKIEFDEMPIGQCFANMFHQLDCNTGKCENSTNPSCQDDMIKIEVPMVLYVSRILANLPLKIGQCKVTEGNCVCDQSIEDHGQYDLCPEGCVSIDGLCKCHEDSCQGSANIVRSCANSLAMVGKSDFMLNVGDGSCDEFLNTKSCRFDGGDCQI